ncbi:MAG: PepSY-associated TM helix domain-containing protein [Bacteroidota bacterium]
MKFKRLPLRAYNVLFHTHTVSGIVISLALFVIFFCGAFTLFRHEIYHWENQDVRRIKEAPVDYEQVLTVLQTNHPNFAPEKSFTLRLASEEMPVVQFFGSEHVIGDTARKFQRFRAKLDPVTLAEIPSDPKPTTVSDTLYRLHFFGQIPVIGLWLSGLTALFFLFAIVTGVLIHWQDIVKKFYAFSIRRSAKQIWTLGHTSLGIIGLPYQVMYAITGALFGLLTLLLAPSAYILFDGNRDQIIAAVAPERAARPDSVNYHFPPVSLNELQKTVDTTFADYATTTVRVSNYGKETGLALFYVDDHATIQGNGVLALQIHGGKEVARVDPVEKGYTETVDDLLLRLHFGTYGNPLTKWIYFILAIMTCFMLLSGIMLWQKARDNARYTDKQRRFHYVITKWMICVSLALFPGVALLFLANKWIPIDTPGHTTYVNAVFFLGWVALIATGLFRKGYFSVYRWYLALGGVLSLLVPITNGIVTGDWFWIAIADGMGYVAGVDLFFLSVGIVTLGLLRYPARNWTRGQQVLARKTTPNPSATDTAKPSVKKPRSKPRMPQRSTIPKG